MPKREITITFRLPMDLVNRFEKIATLEKKSTDELFQEMFYFYEEMMAEKEWEELTRYAKRKAKEAVITEKDIVRIVREVRAEQAAGRHTDDLSDEDMEQIVHGIKAD